MMLCFCQGRNRIRPLLHARSKARIAVHLHLLSNSLPIKFFSIFRPITIQIGSQFESCKNSIARNGVAKHTRSSAWLQTWEPSRRLKTVRPIHGRSPSLHRLGSGGPACGPQTEVRNTLRQAADVARHADRRRQETGSEDTQTADSDYQIAKHLMVCYLKKIINLVHFNIS